MRVTNPTKIGETFLFVWYNKGMKAIPREVQRVTYSSEIRNLKKRLRLNDIQRAIVYGTLLGDACLMESWSNEGDKKRYRLKVDHSIKQQAYVRWKYQKLHSWFLSPPKYSERTRSLRLSTVSHPELTALHEQFYWDGRKVLPRDFTAMLHNPLMLAVWFMDDGNVRRQYGSTYGYHLNTQSFTDAENELLQHAFMEELGISAMLHRNHGKYRIYFGAAGREEFRKIVAPYVIPSMRYKLG